MPDVVPYLQLMRLNSPVECLLVYFPYMLGSLYAVASSTETVSWSFVARRNVMLYFTAAILHAAGCAWNDIIDADVDKRVARTKTRPIPRGSISIQNACIFTFGLCVVWLSLAHAISREVFFWSLPLIPTSMIYPFLKRVTYFPSVFLGPILAWGVYVGCVAMDQNPLDNSAGIFGLIAAESINVVILDMVYTFQDLKDDLNVGVLSMAVRFKKNPRTILISLIVLQLFLRAFSGVSAGFSGIYLLASLAPTVFHISMIAQVDLNSPASCWSWFKLGSLLLGPLCSMAVNMEVVTRGNWLF